MKIDIQDLTHGNMYWTNSLPLNLAVDWHINDIARQHLEQKEGEGPKGPALHQPQNEDPRGTGPVNSHYRHYR